MLYYFLLNLQVEEECHQGTKTPRNNRQIRQSTDNAALNLCERRNIKEQKEMGLNVNGIYK